METQQLGFGARTSNDANLHVYLNDHLSGAAAGTRLAARVARAQGDTPMGRELDLIVVQIAEDRTALIDIMHSVGVTPSRFMEWLGRMTEAMTRFKPNGRLLGRTPITTLIELETLRLGVLGKLQGWTTLAHTAEYDTRLDRAHLHSLERKAVHQASLLEELRLAAAASLGERH